VFQAGPQSKLAEAKALGLEYIEMTMDQDSIASQHVMLASGAVLVERFRSRPSTAGSMACGPAYFSSRPLAGTGEGSENRGKAATETDRPW